MSGQEVWTITISVVMITVITIASATQWGVNAENGRLYNKCLAKNSEMVYNKAIEECKEQVK